MAVTTLGKDDDHHHQRMMMMIITIIIIIIIIIISVRSLRPWTRTPTSSASRTYEGEELEGHRVVHADLAVGRPHLQLLVGPLRPASTPE
jgi:heme/copper-type cytochrome/quinol oxidase subunit 2